MTKAQVNHRSLILVQSLLALTACGATPRASTPAGGPPLPAYLKLYAAPHAAPRPSCDVYTALTLENGVASLVNRREGTCEILVRPEPRQYAVSLADALCGVATWRGPGIEIKDARGQTCGALAPAPVVVSETSAVGRTVTRYSRD